MKKNHVFIGRTYLAKVSGQLARVRIDAESRYGGWDATNVSTRRKVRIKSALRLRREVSSEKANGPPQDIDDRLAAAPPSIVPYEVRRARAEAAQPPPQPRVDEPRLDPWVCANDGCGSAAVLEYLGRPLCQACWERQCSEHSHETTGDACRSIDERETHEQENAMSKSKSPKKQSKKASKPKGQAKPKVKATTEQKPKRVSALDAAAQVLKAAGKPMRAQDLIAAMSEQGLWSSPAGKTPSATLYAAMLREIGAKGSDARFTKVDRGMFAYRGKEA